MLTQALYRATGLPVLQNRIFGNRQDALCAATGDVELVRDLSSGLIFNHAFSPDSLKYDSEYQNEQALSASFRTHLIEVEKIIARHFGEKSVIEVGCGKGYFLEQLLANGFKITGFDPAYEGSNPAIVKTSFGDSTELTSDGIILRHVLEHIPNPFEFLSRVTSANRGRGCIYIEVPCFDWICENQAWFDIFYEHVNYFRMSDFYRMFGKIHESGYLFGKQYLYVVADLASLKQPRLDANDGFRFPPRMDALPAVAAERLRHEIGDAPQKALWGASSKGVVFGLMMQRQGISIDYVVDINPAKQGKYLPVSGLLVSSPAELVRQLKPGSTILVMNSNYLSEVRSLTRDHYSYRAIDHETI